MAMICGGLVGWSKWSQREELGAPILALSFHTFTVTLLSLILPLSFLLLARLSIAQHLLSYTPYPTPSSIILSLFLYTTPPFMHSLVVSITATALVCTLAGRARRPHLYVSWALLFVLQLCVGLGIEATPVASTWPVHINDGCVTWLRRVMFFIGLHEMMLFWSRTIVRPVVDDAIYGVVMEEWAVEKVATAAAFSALWWWRLRNEVEVLVAMVEVKKEALMGMDVVDLVGWMVYYMTVIMGVVRFMKGSVWLSQLLLHKEPNERFDSHCGEDDKV
ncbi:uncharacterized protein LOC131230835 [Magnolia sinica]|uniref:uncharacterized protein LOC131230835 n=1 Tax=Magnolia sinica TaxID=86752 RepID=UPI00265AB7CF|nr:uncharacterized protein LOC131230835 [Magnolia sinica]